MDAAMRELRIGNLRTKIVACVQECAELARKSSPPDLPPEERAAMVRLQEKTIRQCEHARYMLGLYERQGQATGTHKQGSPANGIGIL